MNGHQRTILADFGVKLRQFRAEKDLSQADVAKALGVDKSNVSNWENGKITPALESVIGLAKLFGVSTDYLIFDNVPREGVEAINDFELYQLFRQTEKLAAEDKKLVSDLIKAILFKAKVDFAKQEITELPPQLRQKERTAR